MPELWIEARDTAFNHRFLVGKTNEGFEAIDHVLQVAQISAQRSLVGEGADMPDRGHFVRIGRVNTNGPTTHLVGGHERTHHAGQNQRVHRRCIPAFAEQGPGTDQHLDVTIDQQLSQAAGQALISGHLDLAKILQ